MSTPTQNSFRAQLSGFRWANSVQDDSAATTAAAGGGAPSAAAGGNVFTRTWGTLSSGVSDYVPLRSGNRSDEEEAYFALSRWERFLGFIACIAGGVICFFVAFLTLPILVLKPRKFVMAFTLGSILFMAGFAVLQGPVNHLKHILSKERLPFSIAYFGSLGLTLWFSIGLQSKLLTLLGAIAQVAALLTYLAAYFPGGLTTLRFGGQIDIQESLLQHIYTAHVTCLNESSEHGVKSIVGPDASVGNYLESEVDPELLIHLPFNQPVRLKSITIACTSKPSAGPRTIRLFTNHPQLDFNDASQEQPVQEFELSSKQVAGEKLDLRFVRFQNVNNLYIYVVDNQEDEETTRIDRIDVVGTGEP